MSNTPDDYQQKIEQNEQLSPDQMRADPSDPSVPTRGDYEPTEMTTWDGAGNPITNVFTGDSEGRLAEGTGANREEAIKDAKESDVGLGGDVSPSMESEAGGKGEPLG